MVKGCLSVGDLDAITEMNVSMKELHHQNETIYNIVQILQQQLEGDKQVGIEALRP